MCNREDLLGDGESLVLEEISQETLYHLLFLAIFPLGPFLRLGGQTIYLFRNFCWIVKFKNHAVGQGLLARIIFFLSVCGSRRFVGNVET